MPPSDYRMLTRNRGSRTPRPESRKPDFSPKIEVDIAGVLFQNPVLTASGTFGYGQEFAHLFDLNRLGGICVKGISADPMSGNPAPRIYETHSGMLNAIGLQNVGARRFVLEKLPFLRTVRARTVVNVFGPNTRCGGIVYGSDPKLTEEVVAASKRVARFPLFVKLSPNVTDIAVFAWAAEAGGAD